MELSKTEKAIAAGVLLLTAVGAGFAGAGINEQTHEPVEVEVEVEKIVNNTITETVTELVEVPVNVTVEKIVEDESFKVLSCDRLGYDILSECVEEVNAEDVALGLAVAELESEFAEELEDRDVVDDEDDISLVKIYSDFEDINVVKSNFDRDKYVFEIDVKYDDDEEDKKSTKTFTVKVEDGEAEITNIA